MIISDNQPKSVVVVGKEGGKGKIKLVMHSFESRPTFLPLHANGTTWAIPTKWEDLVFF